MEDQDRRQADADAANSKEPAGPGVVPQPQDDDAHHCRRGADAPPGHVVREDRESGAEDQARKPEPQPQPKPLPGPEQLARRRLQVIDELNDHWFSPYPDLLGRKNGGLTIFSP